MDHLWHRPGGVKGKRAPDDKYHLVAMCWGHNMRVSRELRNWERGYIAWYYKLDLDTLLAGGYEIT